METQLTGEDNFCFRTKNAKGLDLEIVGLKKFYYDVLNLK